MYRSRGRTSSTAARSPYPLAFARVGSVQPRWLTRCSAGSATVVVVVPHRELEDEEEPLQHRPPPPTLQQLAVHVDIDVRHLAVAINVPVPVGLRRRHHCPLFVPSNQLPRFAFRVCSVEQHHQLRPAPGQPEGR